MMADKDLKNSVEHQGNMEQLANLEKKDPKDILDQRDILETPNIVKNAESRLQLKEKKERLERLETGTPRIQTYFYNQSLKLCATLITTA